MEFLIPVRFTGVQYRRVQCDNIKDALKKVESEGRTSANYELPLSKCQHEVLAPVLMLTDEELESWPYWCYGYHGVDGVDWKVNYTNKGKSSIPDYAEESYPVPDNWIESWRKE